MAGTTADKLELLATNKANIKAAIVAKNPTTAPTDVMSQWPTAISSIQTNYYPQPWVGSGTHLWFHFDSDSLTRRVAIYGFIITGTGTINWGDGTTQTVTGTVSYEISHTYAQNGDYRLSITGYDSIARYASTSTFLHDGCDSLVQFECDMVSVSGSSNSLYSYLSNNTNCCTRLKYINFTEATTMTMGCVGTTPLLEKVLTPKIVSFASAFICQTCEWEMPDTLTSFADTYYFTCTTDPKKINKIRISSGLTTLPSNFLFRSSVTELDIPSSITDLGSNFCGYNVPVRRLVVPSGVTQIKGTTFANGMALQYVDLPAGLTSFDSSWAFYATQSLTTLIVRATTPPTLAGNNNFSGTPSTIKVYVPQGCISAYESANIWSKFADHYYELDADGNIPA